MNIKKEIIRNEKMNISLCGQQTIESDLILPDYYGNINKVLKCNIVPICESTACSDNKLSVSGIAKVSLIFSDEDFSIFNYETDIKYTKLFQTENINEYDSFNVSQSVQSLNYRVSGPKHLDINASLQINVKIHGIVETEFVCDAEDKYLSLKSNIINCFQPSAIINRDISTDCDLNLEPGKRAKCIINKIASFKADEVKVIKDKTYIKGHCDIRITYCTTDNFIEVVEKSVTVSEVFETYNSLEHDNYYILDKKCDTLITIKEGSSDNSVFGIRCNISIILKTGRDTEINIISDAYSTKNEVCLATKEIEYIRNVIVKDYKTEILYETESVCADNFEVRDIFTDEINTQIEKNSEGKLILITTTINAIIKRSDGSYNLISRKISAKQLVEDVGYSAIYSCEVLSINALQVAGGKIKFSVTLKTELCSADKCKTNVLSDIALNEEIATGNSKGIILYFAEAEEDIWQIAKSNRTSTEEIKRLNAIENEILEENKLLIFSDM